MSPWEPKSISCWTSLLSSNDIFIPEILLWLLVVFLIKNDLIYIYLKQNFRIMYVAQRISAFYCQPYGA